jgi:hypothetical protein
MKPKFYQCRIVVDNTYGIRAYNESDAKHEALRLLLEDGGFTVDDVDLKEMAKEDLDDPDHVFDAIEGGICDEDDASTSDAPPESKD